MLKIKGLERERKARKRKRMAVFGLSVKLLQTIILTKAGVRTSAWK